MKKLFAILIAVVLLAALTAVPAAAMEYFTISDYKITANITEKNAYNITEVITTQFSTPRHGIYRSIPWKGTWVRTAANGGSTEWRANISNIRVDGYKYSVSKSGNDVVLKIGDAHTYVEGTQVYTISYTIQYYDDGLPDNDEVYFNLVGTQWDTTIDHVSFSVTLPKSFDAGTLGFSTGSEGSSGYDAESLTYRMDGNTITGEVTKQLSNYQGLTMRMTLPQGYFEVPFQGTTDVGLLIFIAALVVLAFVLFLLYGRDGKVVKTVEFYAPDGMTPSEVGYIIDGATDNRDVVSIILYWANRGYLSVEDLGGNEFILHKLRDLDGNAAPFEEHLFRNLFMFSPVATSSALRNTFYKTVASAKSMITQSFEKDDRRRVFTKASVALRPLISFLTALPVMVTLFLTNYRDLQDMVGTLVITVFLGLLIMLPVMVLVSTLRKWRARGRVSRVVSVVVGLLLCVGAMAAFVALTYDRVYLKALPWCAVLATVLLGLIASFIVKRTPQGLTWMGKICGFRDFLELAERDRLIALVDQDPKYFYNILPYAWVLKLSDKWAKKFESIAIQPPDWYYGHSGMFYPVVFMHDLDRSMTSMQATMVSSPSSSGSGGGSGFSGGGFSGGGGGGGGGGSW